ncbi:hypothetical protein SCACP_32320 [Sporomusa carbonis]|uniref:S-layer homology domain-containing protein n=1 Tax=Sporomusa carbonis TaxID=3076075 RepID=UPI003A7998AB
MKKQTAMALAAVFAMSVAGTALAAPANPFVDVPAKHWAYDSVNKLAKAGVISGFGDGTFKGDKTLTRYEIAVIVAKAMANEDKMDAETQAALKKLEAEFASELNNLGVRVDALEKNASNVKFTGQIRERYEWAKDVDNADLLRVRIFATAKVADGVTFKGRLGTESKWGNQDGKNTVGLEQAYITGKALGVTYNLGRQPLYLGQGLIADTSANNDGLYVTATGDVVKLSAGALKKSDLNYYVGDFSAKVNQNLTVTASYLKDKDATKYETTAAGLTYTGLGKFTVAGEYGKNDAAAESAKAWIGKLKYAGADPSKVNSFGVWAARKQAEQNFDTLKLTTYDGATNASAYKPMDDIKGYEYGVEYTVFKNGVLTVIYNDVKNYTETTDKKNMVANLVYTF